MKKSLYLLAYKIIAKNRRIANFRQSNPFRLFIFSVAAERQLELLYYKFVKILNTISL